MRCHTEGIGDAGNIEFETIGRLHRLRIVCDTCIDKALIGHAERFDGFEMRRHEDLSAAIHEPFGKEGWIQRVARIRSEDEPDAVTLEIDHDGVTDHLVHRVSPGDRVLQVGDLALEGEVGFVRERDGVAEMMGLWGGTRLRWRDQEIEAGGILEAKVLRALREEDGDGCNGLVVEGDLPEAEALEGGTVVVTLGDDSTLAYLVSGAETIEGNSHLVLESDPGIAVDAAGARHLFFPLREIQGRVSYRIRTSSFVVFGGDHAKATTDEER